LVLVKAVMCVDGLDQRFSTGVPWHTVVMGRVHTCAARVGGKVEKKRGKKIEE
jgi:hypothetical protein